MIPNLLVLKAPASRPLRPLTCNTVKALDVRRGVTSVVEGRQGPAEVSRSSCATNKTEVWVDRFVCSEKVTQWTASNAGRHDPTLR